MTPDDTQTAPESPENGAAWLSVSEAAAALDVSVKTIWRRAKAGEITARKVAGARGGLVWKVALNPTGQNQTGTDNRDSQPDNRNGQNPLETDTGTDTRAHSERTNRNAQPDTGTDKSERDGHRDGQNEIESLREQLARERDLNTFFREQLLDANRNAAELRAALRESLRAAPRQLTSGATSGAELTEQTPQRAGEMGQNGTGNAPESSGAGLTYGDLADMLERELGR